MPTTGLYGFKYENMYYLHYNSHDSYFKALGTDLLNEVKHMVKTNTFMKWLDDFKNLLFIRETDRPSFNQIDKCKKILNRNIDIDNCFSELFKHIEGSYIDILKSGFMFVNKPLTEEDVIKLKIEYMYILNFDDKMFEVTSNYNTTKYVLILPENLKVLPTELNEEIKKDIIENEGYTQLLNAIKSINVK
jgi:hypothetical protein